MFQFPCLGVGMGEGARGDACPPHFPGRGGWKEISAPHFWARTYLKIPPSPIFFHPHNSTVLTPNQSVRRCFEKFIGVGTGAGTPPPRVFLRCVCVGGEGGPSCWKPLRASFSVSSDITFCIISVYQSNKNKLYSFPNAGSAPGWLHTSLITLTYLGA